MTRFLSLFLISIPLLGAQAPIYIAPPTSIDSSTATLPINTPSKEKKAVASKETSSTKDKGSEVMIISPEGRAKDIQEAIKFLKLKSPAAKPTIELMSGERLVGIQEVDVMPGGTIVIFRLASLKGLQYRVEKIEDIDRLSYE
ncbi:MAG: hypothetical protein KDK60_01425 [Chlamydiia bacterium]|nr:hypothetical protein [Chlamydiia bacterium]